MDIFGLRIERQIKPRRPATIGPILPRRRRLWLALKAFPGKFSPNWRRLSIVAFIALQAIFFIGAAFIGGWTLGNRDADHFDPFGSDFCRQTASQATANAMFRRNAIWKVWNAPGKADKDDPDTKLAVAIGLIIHPTTPPDGLPILIQNLKRRPFVSDEPLQKLEGSDDLVERVRLIRAYARENLNSDEIIRQVICDSRRVSLFINEQPIPLERLPDGTVP